MCYMVNLSLMGDYPELKSIRLRQRTWDRLRRLKKALGVRSYQEAIDALLDAGEAAAIRSTDIPISEKTAAPKTRA